MPRRAGRRCQRARGWVQSPWRARERVRQAPDDPTRGRVACVLASGWVRTMRRVRTYHLTAPDRLVRAEAPRDAPRLSNRRRSPHMPTRSGTAARLLAWFVGLVILVLAFVPTGMLALDWLGPAAAATAAAIGSTGPGSAVPASPTPAATVTLNTAPIPVPSASPTPVPSASPAASPAPLAGPFAMDTYQRGVFVSEETKTSCASAAI